MRHRHRSFRAFSPVQRDPRLVAGIIGQWIGVGSGPYIPDYSGIGNHAQLLGGASWTLGRHHQRTIINYNTAGYVETAATTTGSSLSAVGTALTVAHWVFVNRDTGAAQMFLNKPVASAAHTDPYFVYGLHTLQDGTIRFAIDIDGGSFSQAGNCAVSAVGARRLGEWQHVAGTYDGVTQRLYLNGIEVGTKARTGDISEHATPVRLGVNGALGEQLDGRLEDMRVYNRVLSPCEIVLLADPAFQAILPTSRRHSTIAFPGNGNFNFSGF